MKKNIIDVTKNKCYKCNKFVKEYYDKVLGVNFGEALIVLNPIKNPVTKERYEGTYIFHKTCR